MLSYSNYFKNVTIQFLRRERRKTFSDHALNASAPKAPKLHSASRNFFANSLSALLAFEGIGRISNISRDNRNHARKVLIKFILLSCALSSKSLPSHGHGKYCFATEDFWLNKNANKAPANILKHDEKTKKVHSRVRQHHFLYSEIWNSINLRCVLRCVAILTFIWFFSIDATGKRLTNIWFSFRRSSEFQQLSQHHLKRILWKISIYVFF